MSETAGFRLSRVMVLSRIRMICRRSDQVLFGEDIRVESAAGIVEQCALVFPELFRHTSKATTHALENAETSRLVWVRDSLTTYCVSLEDEDRRERLLSASRRPGASKYRPSAIAFSGIFVGLCSMVQVVVI